MRTDSALPRSPSIASATAGSSSAPVEVDEEHVAAEAAAQRPRLDPGQVDLAVGELGQRLDERAGMVVAELGEDQRRPPRARRPRAAVPRGRDPDEAGDVVGLVLDPLARARRSRRARRPSARRAPPTARSDSRDLAHRLGGAAAPRAPRPAGSCSRMKRAHWALAWGWESTASTSSSASSVAGDQAVADRVVVLADDRRRRSVSNASVSSVVRTEPSIEFSNGTRARSASPLSTARIAS